MLTPTLNRLGIGAQRGGTPLRKSRRPGQAATPLSAMLPNFEPRYAYFSEVPVPAAYTAVAGNSAWYSLRRMKVRRHLGEAQGLFAIGYEMLSPDTNAGGTPSAGTAQAWGNVRGGGAALVVGVNLPVQPGSWTTAPYFGPGVEAASPGLLSSNTQPMYLWHRKFPPGTLVDATTQVQRHEGTRSLMPAIYPLRPGDNLDVALVLSGATVQAAAGASRVFVGEALISLYLARPYIRQDAD